MLRKVSLAITLIVLAVGHANAQSAAARLASIDYGTVLQEEDSRVTIYRSLLDSLDTTYLESPQILADIAVTAQNHLNNEYGLSLPILSILSDTNRIITPSKGPIPNYAEWIFAYVTMLGNGKSRDEAILDLKALANTLGY